MEDKFVKELKLLLKRLQEGDSFLKVKWETGGDEQFINFDFFGPSQESIETYEDMLNELRKLLIDTFDLPDASEYYNNGFAKFFLSEKNAVMIEYTEIEVEEDFRVKEVFDRFTPVLCFNTTELMLEFLAKKKKTKLKYVGEIEFYGTKKTFLYTEENVYVNSTKDKSDQLLNELEAFLVKVIPYDLKNHKLRFEGDLNQQYVSFREIDIVKKNVMKNNKNVTTVLVS